MKAILVALFFYAGTRMHEYDDLGENVPATLLNAVSSYKRVFSWKK
jgi:hypothetical protein